VCGSFWGLKKIQNGGHCHGNQGAKNVKLSTRQKLPHTTANIPTMFDEV
jgi:hypothetical protein